MERKVEREWVTAVCPGSREKTSLMCEWEILSEKGRIFERKLKQIDCGHPALALFGGRNCGWECEGVVRKREK